MAGEAAIARLIFGKECLLSRDTGICVTFAGRIGTMSERFLSKLTDLAFNIDDLSERGDITISGAVEGRYLVITITSLSDGDVRRIVIPP